MFNALSLAQYTVQSTKYTACIQFGGVYSTALLCRVNYKIIIFLKLKSKHFFQKYFQGRVLGTLSVTEHFAHLQITNPHQVKDI